MKNLFVPYTTAVALKQKGFNEPCIMHYIPNFCDNELFNEMENPFSNKLSTIKNSDGENIGAPLYQQVNNWLLKKYDVFIEIKRLKVMADPEDNLYVYWYEVNGFISQHYKTPTQALKKGIEQVLKSI